MNKKDLTEADIRTKFIAPAVAASGWDLMTQLREGLSFVRTTPTVLLAMLVVGLVSAVAMNFSVVIPPLAEGVLHSDAAGYGFLMAVTVSFSAFEDAGNPASMT